MSRQNGERLTANPVRLTDPRDVGRMWAFVAANEDLAVGRLPSRSALASRIRVAYRAGWSDAERRVCAASYRVCYLRLTKRVRRAERLGVPEQENSDDTGIRADYAG